MFGLLAMAQDGDGAATAVDTVVDAEKQSIRFDGSNA